MNKLTKSELYKEIKDLLIDIRRINVKCRKENN
jgi:hypothetical protein